MPSLQNTKRELFATELARGASAKDAYERAGYRPHRANAANLAKTEEIQVRVAEILAEREAIHAQGTADAIREVAISKEWILGELRSNALKARELGQYAASNRALELLGKERGMFINQVQLSNVVYSISDEPMSEEEWEAKHCGPDKLTEH